MHGQMLSFSRYRVQNNAFKVWYRKYDMLFCGGGEFHSEGVLKSFNVCNIYE